MMKLRGESRIRHLLLHIAQVSAMLRRQIARHLQCAVGAAGVASKLQVAFRQYVQALLGRDAREVAYCKTVFSNTRRLVTDWVIAFQIDSQGHHAHLALRNAKVPAHEVRVILAHGREACNVFDIGPDQFQGPASIRLRKLAEKQILALQGAAHRPIHGLVDGLRQSDQQGIRQRDNVRRRLFALPLFAQPLFT